MASLIILKIPVNLNEILKEWSRQAGCFSKEIPVETREIKYMNALMELFSLFARHHEELTNGDFVRIYRFFKDAGFTKRLSKEANISNRYAKLEHQEPLEKKITDKI